MALALLAYAFVCMHACVYVCRLQSFYTRAYTVPCQNNRGKQTLPVLQ